MFTRVASSFFHEKVHSVLPAFVCFQHFLDATVPERPVNERPQENPRISHVRACLRSFEEEAMKSKLHHGKRRGKVSLTVFQSLRFFFLARRKNVQRPIFWDNGKKVCSSFLLTTSATAEP